MLLPERQHVDDATRVGSEPLLDGGELLLLCAVRRLDDGFRCFRCPPHLQAGGHALLYLASEGFDNGSVASNVMCCEAQGLGSRIFVARGRGRRLILHPRLISLNACRVSGRLMHKKGYESIQYEPLQGTGKMIMGYRSTFHRRWPIWIAITASRERLYPLRATIPRWCAWIIVAA